MGESAFRRTEWSRTLAALLQAGIALRAGRSVEGGAVRGFGDRGGSHLGLVCLLACGSTGAVFGGAAVGLLEQRGQLGSEAAPWHVDWR